MFMETNPTEHPEPSVNLLSLPVELLVYIASFIHATRDLVKLRYVSKTLRVVTETSSLWNEFVWPFYDPREERSVMNVLKDLGKYIKRLIFPNHVAQSKLLGMVSLCKNVTHLALPAVTELDLDKVKRVVQPMRSLEKLEVRLCSHCIEPLLLIGGLKKLTINVIEGDISLVVWCVEEWMRMGFKPPNFVMITKQLGLRWFVSAALANQFTTSNGHLSTFTLYYDNQAPLNLYPSMPVIYFEYGHGSSSPFVKASSYGILGLDIYVLLLTKDSKGLCKAEFAAIEYNDDMINTSVNTLKFVTEFSFGPVQQVYPGHLEQLAFACPNLERLNLGCHSECLHNLQGIRTIVQRCRNLNGLDLTWIPLNKIGRVRELWEILASVRLTYLCIDLCTFEFCKHIVTSKQPLMKSLQALMLDAEHDNFDSRDGVVDYFCQFCKNFEFDWSLLSNFTALRYCRLFTDDPAAIQDITTACKTLVCLYCNAWKQLLLTSIYCPNVEQFCIKSACNDIPNSFMDDISFHGKLVHVIMYVNSVTAEGVISLIKNSPGLLTLIIVAHQHVYNEQGERVYAKDIRAIVKKTFPHAKLFSVGDYRMLQDSDSYSYWNTDEFLYGTDLQLLQETLF